MLALEPGSEVRLEVDHPHLDSDAVLSYLAPGAILGELSLLDGQPRSASALLANAVEVLGAGAASGGWQLWWLAPGRRSSPNARSCSRG